MKQYDDHALKPKQFGYLLLAFIWLTYILVFRVLDFFIYKSSTKMAQDYCV